MRKTVVLLVVGLTPRHLGPHTRNLSALARHGGLRPVKTVTPALTCSVQATFLTGLLPNRHGAVANGWLFRDQMEVLLWRQSNRLIAGEKIWEAGKKRDPAFSCANLFWWYNMAASHDFGATPRPIYKADGRKLPDCYTVPAALRDELTAKLGPFPLFEFWGPGASIASSRWIAEAAAHLLQTRRPTLTLVYLPHLDYDLQRHGPDGPHLAKALGDIDQVAGRLIDLVRGEGSRVVVLSEYGVTRVNRPILINRALREAGFLAVRVEDGGELLDPIASRAFALADHQIAHLYVNDPAAVTSVKRMVEALPGVYAVLDEAGKKAFALDHPRSGELIALARSDAWFAYPYWLQETRAPDFARTVDIHRKPGYDPVELFFDPAIRYPRFAVGWRLLKRKLGFRTLMDVIPLDPGLVKGSHGHLPDREADGPLFITSEPSLVGDGPVSATDVKRLVLEHVFSRD
ncbi:MAG TPA: nucleotide pyrophosphatase/phosphodiesterase family protein [Hyphomicrobiaceae bacterium]|nr:nucleotide pyrophosphatase/phosphodiesterase family protein [Hyphomicrobiaceae bacterium]